LLLASPRLLPAKPCVCPLRLPDCGGVNVCHPGRLDVIAPWFSFEPLKERLFPLALAPNDSRDRTLLLGERPPNPLDAVFVRPAALKKCCEPEGAFRYDAGLAAWPAAL
jgi:hypothetical protein